MSLSASEEADLQWWQDQARPCPECGDRGVPIILDIVDEGARRALQFRFACLGDCCMDGLAPDRECRKCGHRF